MKLFLGYKSYRLKKISQTMKEKKEKTREKKNFPIQEIDSSCCKKPGIMVKNIPLESYHK